MPRLKSYSTIFIVPLISGNPTETIRRTPYDGHLRTRRELSSNPRLRGGAGRTRTSNQTVMGGGYVRPAHLVEHQALEARRVPRPVLAPNRRPITSAFPALLK